MQSGELLVIGSNRAKILLRGLPAEIRVKFKHPEVVVPCDPGNVDSLEYEVHNIVGKIYLIIKWDVSSLREIKWEAAY